MFTFFKVIAGFLVISLFVYIPTLLSNPHKQIGYIEHDLELVLPSDYKVVRHRTDWLGFDETQAVELSFTEDDYDNLIAQIKDNSVCKNGEWIRDEEGFRFKLKDDFTDLKNYYFEAKTNNEQRLFSYVYRGL